MTRLFASLTLVATVVLSAGYATSGSGVPPPSRQSRHLPAPAPTHGGGEARPAPPTPSPQAVPAGPPCIASYYSEEHRGRTMANGEPFNPDALTAAHPTLPFGTVLEVTSVETGVTVEVTVTDRGPAARLGRCIDLSRASFEALGVPLSQGLASVIVHPDSDG